MASLFYLPWAIVRDVAGVGIPGAQVYFTQTGTNTKKSVYQDSGLATPHTNPVICDGVGNPPITYLDPLVSYRVRVYDRDAEAGVDTPIKDIDPYVPGIFADATALQPVADDAANSASAATNSAAVAAAAVTTVEGIVASANDMNMQAQAAVTSIAAALGPTVLTLSQLVASGMPLNARWFGSGSTEAEINAAIVESQGLATGSSGGPPVYIPYGDWNVANVLDLTVPIEIFGDCSGPYGNQTALNFVGNTSGIRVQGYGTSGATGSGGTGSGADGTLIRNLKLNGAYVATHSEAHGIHVRGKTTVRDVQIANFSGNGIHVVAVFAGGNGNANGSRFENMYITACRNGTFADGGDANNCTFSQVSCLANRLSGHYDSSFLGNNYFGGDLSSNGNDSSHPTRCTYSSKVYAVALGQETWCSTNAPSGTTAHNTGWIYVGSAGALTPAPAWSSGLTWYFSAPFVNDDFGNQGTRFDGLYVEFDQNPCILAGSGLFLPGTQLVSVMRANGTLADNAFRKGGGLLTNRDLGVGNNLVVEGAFASIGPTSDPGTVFDETLEINNWSNYSFLNFKRLGVLQGQVYSSINNLYYKSVNHNFQLLDGTQIAGIAAAGINLASGKVLQINGTQVVGAQGAAVADAAALTSVNGTNAAAAPTQAEFDALVAEFNKLRTDLGATRTTLNTTLARNRAHGLIAP